MGQSSTKDRRIRQLKRERNRAYRELDATWRHMKEVLINFNASQAELKQYIKKYGKLEEEIKGTNSVASQLAKDSGIDAVGHE